MYNSRLVEWLIVLFDTHMSYGYKSINDLKDTLRVIKNNIVLSLLDPKNIKLVLKFMIGLLKYFVD